MGRANDGLASEKLFIPAPAGDTINISMFKAKMKTERKRTELENLLYNPLMMFLLIFQLRKKSEGTLSIRRVSQCLTTKGKREKKKVRSAWNFNAGQQRNDSKKRWKNWIVCKNETEKRKKVVKYFRFFFRISTVARRGRRMMSRTIRNRNSSLQ